RAADKAQFGIVRLANHQVIVFARDADRATAGVVDCLHDPLVDKTRENHFHHLDRLAGGDALTAHKTAFDAQLAQQFVDHRATAMTDHRMNTDLFHQHDIAGKFGHGRIVAHGVTTEFHDHD